MGRPKGLPKTGGKPKGFKAPATLAKEAAREAVRLQITARLAPLVDAQIDSAIGIKHFFLRDASTGEWKRITNPAQIERALNGKEDKYLIYTKDPNSTAAREMLAYAIDKPKESMDLTVTDESGLVTALMEGRKRAAEKAKK